MLFGSRITEWLWLQYLLSSLRQQDLKSFTGPSESVNIHKSPRNSTVNERWPDLQWKWWKYPWRLATNKEWISIPDTILTSNQEPNTHTLTWKKMENIALCAIRSPVKASIEKMKPTTKIRNICMGKLPNSTDLPHDFTNDRGEICKVGWLMDVWSNLGEPIPYISYEERHVYARKHIQWIRISLVSVFVFLFIQTFVRHTFVCAAQCNDAGVGGMEELYRGLKN